MPTARLVMMMMMMMMLPTNRCAYGTDNGNNDKSL